MISKCVILYFKKLLDFQFVAKVGCHFTNMKKLPLDTMEVNRFEEQKRTKVFESVPSFVRGYLICCCTCKKELIALNAIKDTLLY